MRVFLAIVPPKGTVDNLERSQKQLLPFLTAGRVVDKANFHITVVFLGEVEQHNLIFVQSAMSKLKHFKPFDMAVSQISTLSSAKIVCAKYKTSKNLTELHQTLCDELSNMGFSVEKRVFRPHTTLIRQFKFDTPFSEVVKHVDVFNKPFEVQSVKLLKSVFEPNGVRYEEICEVVLGS